MPETVANAAFRLDLSEPMLTSGAVPTAIRCDVVALQRCCSFVRMGLDESEGDQMMNSQLFAGLAASFVLASMPLLTGCQTQPSVSSQRDMSCCTIHVSATERLGL